MIKLQQEELNSRLNQLIKSSELKLERLNKELEVNLEGLVLAKKRSFLMQGKLVDLREAIRNVLQIRSSLTEV